MIYVLGLTLDPVMIYRVEPNEEGGKQLFLPLPVLVLLQCCLLMLIALLEAAQRLKVCSHEERIPHLTS